MTWLRRFVTDNLLIICIAAALALALAAPAPKPLAEAAWLVKLLLILIFFCQGLTFKPSADLNARSLVPLFLWGLAVSQVLGPLAGLAGARLLPLAEDYRVGLILMCCMAPTLVSGAVLAVKAGGDAAAALLLAVGVNMASVFTIPLGLGLTLGAQADLDVWGLLSKLVLLVLLPAVAGRLAGRYAPRAAARVAGVAKQVPIFALAATVYLAVGKQADALKHLPLTDLAVLAAASLAIHFLLMIVAHQVSRRVLGLGPAAAKSVALVTSEKTLPLAVAVWTLALATQHPLAVLAPIVFHPSQILADGMLANYWSKRG